MTRRTRGSASSRPRIFDARRSLAEDSNRLAYGFGVAVDDSDDDPERFAVYVADVAGAVIVRFRGDHVDILGEGALARPYDVVALRALYAADRDANAIVRVGADGSAETVVAELSAPVALALDADGALVVAERGADAGVRKYWLDSGETSATLSGPGFAGEPVGVCCGARRAVFACTTSHEVRAIVDETTAAKRTAPAAPVSRKVAGGANGRGATPAADIVIDARRGLYDRRTGHRLTMNQERFRATDQLNAPPLLARSRRRTAARRSGPVVDRRNARVVRLRRAPAMATQNAQVKRLDDPFGAFVVDGFNFVKAFPDVRHWLLTHAHSDHTCGLRANFDAGTIYCSTITKRLVAREFPGRLGDRIETLDPGASNDFPSQGEACAVIADVVTQELAREPKTLFLANAYSVGKENAFDAAIRASGGLGYVIGRRAESLRACGRWDPSLHTEDASDERVAVWVGHRAAPGARDGDDGPHGQLAKVLADAPRFKAVVSLRCTGWEYQKSCRCAGGGLGGLDTYCPKVWEGNDGATRAYGVPYSEHSSFPELKRFVAALRPRKLVPTVNAATRVKRDGLRDLFADGVEHANDRSKMDAYLASPTGGDALRGVDVRRQARLLEQFERTPEAPSPVDAGKAATVREVVGDAPDRYVAALLGDAGGDVAAALSVHFGAHGGVVPPAYYASAPAPSGGPSEDDDADLLVGAVFAVKGRDEDFKLFRTGGPPPPKRRRGEPRPKGQQPGGAAEKVRERLRQLGACVVGLHDTGAKKLAPTHVVVPEGTEPGSLVGLDHLVRVKTESWLLKRVRALEAGTVRKPTEADFKAAEQKKTDAVERAKVNDVGPNGEKRAGPRRKATAETAATAHRALTETMYLVDRRDETRPPPPGACRPPPLKHKFVVMGTTGNVYDVTLDKEPRCTCPLALKHKSKVCKHRYFVFYRVLRLPRDDDEHDPKGLKHVPHQRYLRRDELKAILVDSSTADAPLASRAARDAYRRHSGVIDVDDDGPARDVARRPLAADPCEICFEPFPEGPDGAAFSDFCRGGCGRNYHHECLKRCEGRLWTDVHGDRAAHAASLARGDEPPPPPPPDCTPPDDGAIW
ncbi:hypothetical protein JL721_5588 [Aureococcus anophagefferens]|nr:hypothetical protein JL721_5588 [Aureococcus anophagefferens]